MKNGLLLLGFFIITRLLLIFLSTGCCRFFLSSLGCCFGIREGEFYKDRRTIRGCQKEVFFTAWEGLFEGIERKSFWEREKYGCLKGSVGSFQSEGRRHLNSPTGPFRQQPIHPRILENVLAWNKKKSIISHQPARHYFWAPLEKWKQLHTTRLFVKLARWVICFFMYGFSVTMQV